MERDAKLKLNPEIDHVYIVGAGGVASYLIEPLLKLLAQVAPDITVTIIDGDELEERNLDRQLFDPKQVGQFKADALADLVERHAVKIKIETVTEWFVDGMEVKEGALFFSCVDNHPARRAILSTVDITHGYAILAGNEYTDAEAFFYSHEWRGTELDPRNYYPSIMTDNADDPLRRAIGCTGEAQVATPQLALANMGAAYYSLHLFWFWFVMAHQLDKETQGYSPIRNFNNFSRCGTALRSEFKPKPVQQKEQHEKD